MITIFTIPKPFKGHIKTIQRNAIKSWIALKPKCEVILFGNEDGVLEAANEFKVKCISKIEKNHLNTPLLSSAFKMAKAEASNNILVYVNSDMIFFQDLLQTIQSIKINKYFGCGRRVDLDINFEINLENKKWVQNILQDSRINGKLHGYSGIDYFIFKNHYIDLPKFTVGRLGWDNWVLYQVRSSKVPIIDCTKSIYTIHQNHNYHHIKNKRKNNYNVEAKANYQLIGGKNKMLTIREADLICINGVVKSPEFPNNIFLGLSRLYLWRKLLEFKRYFNVGE
ncbi:hypothetical protein OAF50_03775 [bacterium]|nr:hypothetical protein [bacterium]